MKEIGGYIELDTYRLHMIHEDALALNCGRNALAYLIEARQIDKIWLPYFLCDSVKEVCKKYDIQIGYYHIAPDFSPIVPMLEDSDWLYVVNYYGQLSRNYLESISKQHPKLIIDNAQDYFSMPIHGVDTLYTCRKYFGVSDGAFLYTDALLNRKLPTDESFERIHYLLGRYERNASEFYKESIRNNKYFVNEPVKRMSRLTYNLLHALDYEEIKRCRTKNFAVLADALACSNHLGIRKVDGAFMYPYFVLNADEIKQKLLEQKIYIPTLWPDVLFSVPETWLEWKYAKYILPLPCDQRYDESDMNRMCEVIEKWSEI